MRLLVNYFSFSARALLINREECLRILLAGISEKAIWSGYPEQGLSTWRVGKISHLLWGEGISASEVIRMNKRGKKELIG